MKLGIGIGFLEGFRCGRHFISPLELQGGKTVGTLLNQEYNDYLHSEDFLDAMYRVTIEDGLNKNSRSHLSLADAPIFKDAEAVMALPEVATAYPTDLKKLTFDKSKMPPIGKAVEALKNLHEILVRFEAYRTKKQNEEQP